jgi:hypothetical protein
VPAPTPTPNSSGPTGTVAGPACGFVPAAALADVLGTTRYETAGSLTRTEPARAGACSVIAPENNAPAIQVTGRPRLDLAGRSKRRADRPGDEGDRRAVLSRPGPRRRGRAPVPPEPGRDAVHDAVSLATAVAEELGLPVHCGTSPAEGSRPLRMRILRLGARTSNVARRARSHPGAVLCPTVQQLDDRFRSAARAR